MKKIQLLFYFTLIICVIISLFSERVYGKFVSNEVQDNPLLNDFKTQYNVPAFDKIKTSDYIPAFTSGFQEQNGQIYIIVNNSEIPTFKNTIVPLEKSGSILDRTSRTFFNLKEANTNDDINDIAKVITPQLSEHFDNILMNEALFKRIKFVYDNRDNENLTGEEKKVLEKYYTEFVRGGVNLPEEKKETLKKINKELSLLYLKFGDNVLAEINRYKMFIKDKNDLSGLPETVKNSAFQLAKKEGHNGEWLFTIQKPSMIPFLQFADNRDLREKLLTAYQNIGNHNDEFDNKKIISEIVSLRTKKAHLLGYKSFADYVIEDNMAKTPQNAYELTSKVFNAGLKKAKEERELLQNMVYAEGKNFKLMPWDWFYYAEKIRKADYGIDQAVLSEYFTLDNVIQGMFYTANKLYGIKFIKIKNMPKPHPDAILYKVTAGDGRFIGLLYQDYFARESKRSGAWMDEYRKQSNMDKRKLPVITMVCNFTPPTKDTPSLLTTDEVETAFHEFGHALHGLLSDCKYPKLSGTSVPRDYVELPSQFMENWAFRPEILKHYAFNYKTGKVIPMSYVKKLNDASKFNQGFVTSEVQSAALLDLAYHTRESDEEIRDVEQFEKEYLDKIGLIPEIVVRYRGPYFSHIFSGEGYSAGYYVYNWAEVLDADAFEAFSSSNDIFNPEKAKLFKEWVLSKGGTGDVMVFYENFRGRKPTVDSLLKRKGLK